MFMIHTGWDFQGQHASAELFGASQQLINVTRFCSLVAFSFILRNLLAHAAPGPGYLLLFSVRVRREEFQAVTDSFSSSKIAFYPIK
jgi:hypothetical protein